MSSDLSTYGDQGFIDALFEAGVVGFNSGKVIGFNGGIWSPGAYIDNRRLQSYQSARRIVTDCMVRYVSESFHCPAVIASVATGAIIPGFALAERLGLPHVTIKKKEKGHGLDGLIDGDTSVVLSNEVLVVEDMSSTFQSTRHALDVLEHTGVGVCEVMLLNTWNFPAFREASSGQVVTVGCTGEQLVQEAIRRNMIEGPYADLLLRWIQDPDDHSWVQDSGWEWDLSAVQ